MKKYDHNNIITVNDTVIDGNNDNNFVVVVVAVVVVVVVVAAVHIAAVQGASAFASFEELHIGTIDNEEAPVDAFPFVLPLSAFDCEAYLSPPLCHSSW
mmetsp:Transcript_10821/g.19731  ORF Transcript_10821/g.19731 Transcript_10821/m.19731 type:complete len:99 (-) Transcript_10821:358-654(-)